MRLPASALSAAAAALLLTPAQAQQKSRSASAKAIPKPTETVPTRPSGTSSELDPALRARIEAFFSLLREERTSAAYEKLFEGSFVAEEDRDLLQQLTDVTDQVMEGCGKLEGTELLSAKSAGRSLRELIYAVNFRKRPVRWRLYAYFSDGRWQIIDTSVNPDVTSFFHGDREPAPQPARTEKQ